MAVSRLYPPIIQNDYKIKTMQQQIKKLHIVDNEKDEVHNNPNLLTVRIIFKIFKIYPKFNVPYSTA
ncbi:hypothetical protein RhiirA1_486718 [Rhizophagus irregularis]|uniref:Uncharacterized protein n=1 Tax=Rhizophagus irregularis TaxID=588596 RepID=A0A2N0QH04_9GLOM|nr:hypothetical protein RhiirA1_486718 [Rhizophagus irregularis]GET50123.1 hypothetical protein GLOIN_2v1737605 [Rhizophagus irregularis DAOM 181602=DAOM 197198]